MALSVNSRCDRWGSRLCDLKGNSWRPHAEWVKRGLGRCGVLPSGPMLYRRPVGQLQGVCGEKVQRSQSPWLGVRLCGSSLSCWPLAQLSGIKDHARWEPCA